MPSYITMLGVVPTKPKLAWNPIYFVSRQAPWDLGRGCRLLWNTSKNQADPTTISKATSLARFCSDEGVGSAVDCAPRRKKVSICSGVRIPVEQWSSPPVYSLASRSVVLESSYSMVQLFSPTSGSQEWIAVVGSAQHKSLLYSLPSGARQTELRAAQRTTSRTTIRSSKALQRGLRELLDEKAGSFPSHCETGILELLDDIRFRSDPRYHVSLCLCSSS